MQKRSSLWEQRPDVVKVDPLVGAAGRLRNRQFYNLIILAPLILLLYFRSAMPETPQWEAALEFSLCLFLLGLEVVVLVQLGNCIALMRRLKRRNQKRQMAAHAHHGVSPEDHPLPALASHQPPPDAAALPLPTILRYRPRWHGILGAAGLYVGIALPTTALLLSLTYWIVSVRFPLFFQIFPLFELFSWTIIVLFIVFLIRACPYIRMLALRALVELEITEQGLTWRRRRDQKGLFIAWSEARLLAIEGYPEKHWQQKLAPLYYELASEKEVIRWLALSEGYLSRSHPRFLLTSQVEDMQLEEYQRKMQALLSVVMAKTHLPLYDLC